MALRTAMQGIVRTMTRRAFGREEMDKIVGSVSWGEAATPDLRDLTSHSLSKLARSNWERVAGTTGVELPEGRELDGRAVITAQAVEPSVKEQPRSGRRGACRAEG